MSQNAILIWSCVNLLLAPLVGYTIGFSGLPYIICLYVLLIFAIAPAAVMAWQSLFHDERDGAAR